MRTRMLALVAAAVLTAIAPAAVAQGEEDCLTHTTAAPDAPQECAETGRQLDVGVEAFEPTIGIDSQGDVYYATTPGRGPLLGRTAGIVRSQDEARTWTDITPVVNAPETYDPYIYVDPATGRVFQFHMFPILTCAVLAFTDDGGDNWTSNPAGCGPTGVWDHQTLVAAKPRLLTPVGYPNIVHQCVNAIYAAMCSRSLDGGLTWSPSTPAFRNERGLCALHGHLAAAPDGTLYLPTTLCGGNPTVYVSRDDGLTWTKSVVADQQATTMDPAVAVDAAGNAYYVWADGSGALLLSVSDDHGASWTDPVFAAPAHVTAALPAVAAGDAGHVVVTYPGTVDLPERGATSPNKPPDPRIRWGGYASYSTNALADDATFTTVRTTGEDPLMRGHVCDLNFGRCSYQVDFLGVALMPDGRPFASFVDGCVGACAQPTGKRNNGGGGIVVTPDVADLCAARCWMFGEPAASSTVDVPTQSARHAPALLAPASGLADLDPLQRARLRLRDAWADGAAPEHVRTRALEAAFDAAQTRS